MALHERKNLLHTQELETDAREYAEEEAMLYLMHVSEYLRDENQIDT